MRMICVLLPVCLLTACSGQDDMDNYVAQTKARKPVPILNAKGDSLRRRWEGNFAGASAPLVLNVLLDHLQRCSAARARKVRA